MQKTKLIVVVIALLFFIVTAAPSFATGPYYKTSTAAKVSHKLWRGTLNVMFCFVEIPLAINKEAQDTDPFTGIWLGTYEGVCRTAARASIGAFEVFTFPFPVPEGYKSPIDPEFPFLKNMSNIIYECKVEEVRDND